MKTHPLDFIHVFIMSSCPCPPPPDSTASIVARRRRFSHLTQELYRLAVVVWDGGEPTLSGTSTLTLRVCPCRGHGRARTCQGEAFLTSAGLSTGALVAILLCVVILLGRWRGGCVCVCVTILCSVFSVLSFWQIFLRGRTRERWR